MNSVSIIIPVHNEENFIFGCLQSVLNFEGLDTFESEILVVDGNSNDKTKEKVMAFAGQNPNPPIRIIENPDIYQSFALNMGIKEAEYEYILRLDAHSIYPKDYLKLLMETALRTKAVNTGGVLITLPYNDKYPAQLVQALTTHKFGVGNSGFRTDMQEGEADTVPFGFFKKEIFAKIGFFDERLIRAQDYEFNQRIRRSGGIIWLNPQIKIEYFNQPNVFKFLKKQLVNEGPYNAYMWYLHPYTLAYRHAIPAFFTLGVLIGIVLSFFFPIMKCVFLSVLLLYLTIAIFSSLQQAMKFKKVLHFFALPVCFFLFHFSYGLGILIGLFKLILRISPVQRIGNKTD
jgi:glycosyltransferase involved in cell wall biosynthesis